jgi:hypothetical protein
MMAEILKPSDKALKKAASIIREGELVTFPTELAFKPQKDEMPFERIEFLSTSGNLREAACNFFSCLHRLDKAGLDIIYAEPVPEVGLGKAIMDRLYKAEGIKNE